MDPEEVTITENNLDNRPVVEVFGRQIDLSSILSKLETVLSKNPQIEEVRFIAGTIFKIDANLEQEVWRGRNVVVHAKEVIVCQPVHWNVSGKDRLHTYEQTAGTATDGNGLNGKDGYAGESGGNVLITARKIKCSDNLTITSNGGNGSNGQDGGNGVAGKDGTGISKKDFDLAFPPACAPSLIYVTNLVKTYKNVQKLSHTVLKQWLKETVLFFSKTYTNNVFNIITSSNSADLYDGFVKGRTEEGHTITFSYQSGIGIDNCQAFLLVEGSPGTPGKTGGEYGLGGEGGKPGEINILEGNHHIAAKTCTKTGADGENGRGGFAGRHGKRGWDMAYMDYTLGRASGSWPKYFGTDETSSLKLDYYENSADDRVRCPYMNDTKWRYAGITVSRLENKHTTSLGERNSSRSNNERQHHAKAVGKKTISAQRVLNAYSEFMNTVEAEIREAKEKQAYEEQQAEQAKRAQADQLAVEMQKLKLQNDATVGMDQDQGQQLFSEPIAQKQEANEMLQELNNQLECDEEESEYDSAQEEIDQSLGDNIPSSECNNVEDDLQELSINRHVPFNPGMEHRKVKVTLSTSGKANAGERTFTKADSTDLDDWLELNTFVIDCDGLKKLMHDFTKVKASLSGQRSKENTTKMEIIDEIFVAKYKLAALQEMTHRLGLNQTVKPQITVQLQIAAKHLTESKAKDNLSGHTVLGTMKQYIFENTQQQRDNLADYVEQELKNDNISFQRTVKVFVLETEYEEMLNESLESLRKELRQPQHANIRQFWDGSDDRPLEDAVRKMLERDETLKKHYDRWNGMKRKIAQYEFADNRCVEEGVRQKFIKHIRSKGITAKSCRALLAYLYNVNLKVYERDDDYELVLREDHNSSSDTSNHILSRGNDFGQLQVNEEYLKLEQDRLHSDRTYGKILHEIDTLKSIKEIDNYLHKNCVQVLQSNSEMIEKYHFDDRSAAETIAAYFPLEERDEIRPMLEKVSFEICKQKGILQHMLRRFSCEGKHVSFNELSFIINTVLDHFVNDGQEEYSFTWIVAAYSQRYWLNEVILLQLETYFKQQLKHKQQWREYMRRIDQKEVLMEFSTELQYSVCTEECVGEILHLLSSVSIESMDFDGIPLSEWGYFLKEHYWTNKLSNVLEWKDDRSLGDATYYIRSVENTFGGSKANELLDKIKRKGQQITATILLDILLNLHKQKWKLSDENIRVLECASSLQEWIAFMEEKYKPTLDELKIEQLTEIIESDGISSTEIIQHLPGIRTSVYNVWNKNVMYNETSVASFTESEIRSWVSEFRNKLDHLRSYGLEIYEEMLAVIDRAIELKRGFRLRDTQRLTVLLLLTNDRSTLAQVSTGEGKSLIVVALSLIKALLREKVDIITSSPVLAKRDSEVNSDIYGLFGIAVSHNCSANIEQRKDAYSMHQVVYGDLANFQRDYLLDRFYGKNILGDRDFANVIVDEVDSMLLDKGNNMLYLSHDIPGMDKLESVYIFIWQMVNNSSERPEDVDIDMVKEEVLNGMYNRIKLDDLLQLDKCLSLRRVNMIWNCLVDGGILNQEGHVVSDTIDSNRLQEVLSPEVKQYNHRLNFLLKECVERELAINVPNHLKKFVERHLTSWIISAINALLMEPGQSYVVDCPKSGSKASRNPGIIILDKDTGADQGSSQWDEALHQFLQLKHGCKLSMQSLKAVFVSNVTYFKMYKLLYGLTGTLGSQRERNLLKEIHQVAFVTIPTAKSKQFEEYEPIIISGHRRWLESIQIEANKLINEENRSVLIICDTINDAECIGNALKEMFANNMHTYTRDYQEFEVVQGSKQLPQGQIIIATNLAGRGTDIRITDQLRRTGGLHVMLTYLPENIRIEEQAFGRAARSGDKGSGRLIITVTSQKQLKKSKIIDLKKKRDEQELHRISEIKAYYEKTIRAEEICFDEFKKVYEVHRKSLDKADAPAEVKTVLQQTCLDQWSFWLDEYSDSMEDIMSDCDDSAIPTVLKNFLSKLSKFDTGVEGERFNSNRWQDWVAGNPMRMVQLANYLSEFHVKKSEDYRKKMAKQAVNVVRKGTFNIEKDVTLAYETAMSLYGEVIKTEPHFSEAAYYYRAYTLMKTIEWENDTKSTTNRQQLKAFKRDLREAIRLFEGHCTFAMQAAATVDKLKRNSFWHEDYQAQKQCMCQLYQSFIRSIEDIFGHAVTSGTFVTENIKEHLSDRIFTKLIEEGAIARPKVRKTISDRQLYSIHKDYGIPIEALRRFLTAHAGPIDVDTFLEEFRRSFPLPSREQFWEILIDQKVLHSVKKYVLVDTVKLEVIDPSLTDALNAKVRNKTLVKESIERDKDQIVLYHELLQIYDTENGDPQANSNMVDIFEQDNFITLIGREKFVMLTRKGIVRCNEKANIDKRMMAACKFSSFDSISAEDIAFKANIVIGEARLIIEELVSRKILARNGDSYVMTDEVRSSEDDLVPTYPVYESSIEAILSHCLSYRSALSNIKKQLENNDQPLRIPLQCNPYPELFQNLLQQNIINPIIVKDANLKDTLDRAFQVKLYVNSNGIIYRQEMVPLFSKSLYISTADSERLYDHFVADIFANIRKAIERAVTIFNPFLFVTIDEKPKSDTKIKFEPLNQAAERLRYDMGKTVEVFLAQQKQFYKTETRSHVENTLKQMKPALVGLKVPNIQLKSIQEVTKYVETNFGNFEEEQLFYLNGLPRLLHLVEKQWSEQMNTNLKLVCGIALAQFAAAAIIEIASAGLMTHVASGLMSEGISDLMYAVSSYRSGYFSWEDYRSEKWKSVLLTAVTAGVGAYFSRGTKVSRIANKVSGPGLMKDGKEIATMTGWGMIKEIGGTRVFSETVKRIVMKTAQGFAQGLANVIVDKFTEDYLQSLIETIAADMLAQTVRKVDDHKIADSLKKIYDELGEEQTRNLVHQLPAFGSNERDTCISYTKQITTSLSQGFASAMQKNQSGNRTMKILSNISTVWVWTERAIEIGKLTAVIGTFLDNLDSQMNKKFNAMANSSSVAENAQPNEGSNFEKFKAEIVNEWKMQLTEHVGRIIAQHIVKPLLTDALNRVGKYIKRIPRNIKQRMLRRRMQRLQKKHDEKMRNRSLTDEAKANLKAEHQAKLLKIMYKTKSPSLFADIILENVPMDLTCAAACTPLVHALLAKMGKPVAGITVTIMGENGIQQTFCTGSLDGGEERKVVLQLKDNHFTFSDSQLNASNNNCFYAALSEAIPELKNIGADEFRKQIADTIRHDSDVQHRIRQGWHRYPIKQCNAVGGRALPPKQKTKRVKQTPQPNVKVVVPRASEAEHLKPLAAEFLSPPVFCPEAKSAALHLYSRLTIYEFEFAGVIQAIVAKTGVPFEKLMEEGASNCTDNLGIVKGGKIHRAHTIRVKINEDALKDHPHELAILKKYAGHREYVCKEANQYDKIGGIIDKSQMNRLKKLVKNHDFSKKPTAEDKEIMQKHLTDTAKLMDHHKSEIKNESPKDDSATKQQIKSKIKNESQSPKDDSATKHQIKAKIKNKSPKYDSAMKQQMEVAKGKILTIDVDKLYEYGQFGRKAV
ncbi:uncharacterized protein LOC118503851 isoform X2 [Anopheles stephensi]|uniref:uncharacterized protein LOC118503851 isoform X2 n=1 Tax=Anopheles stephensi TaxID=30069 RepID=UPI0016587554|nr:uncharacterized protein LOC118503851 isoform X2 [Anopheles stephensi]